MKNKELENLARKLVKTGLTSEELKNVALKHLDEKELKELWDIPRRNITNFVTGCFNNLDLKSPFLDIGCGKRSYQPEAIEKYGHGITYIALDHYLPDDKTQFLRLPNLLASATSLPLSSSSVNTIICSEVLEHIEDDYLVLKEISRVMDREGVLILTLPGRDIPKHEKLPYQIDYRRYDPDGIRNLLETYGFNLLSLETKSLFNNLEINILALAQKRLK